MLAAGGILPNFLLWNFYNTSSLTIENVDLIGTVLAPQADVSFTSGSLTGVLYANTVVGEGSIVGQVC